MRDAWLQAHLGRRMIVVIPGAQIQGKLLEHDGEWCTMRTDEGDDCLVRIANLLACRCAPSADIARAVAAPVDPRLIRKGR